MREFECAFGKGRHFEDSHRAIPNNRCGAGHFFGEQFDGFGTDIETHQIIGNGFYRLSSCIEINVVCDDVVHRQQEFHVMLLRGLQDMVCQI